MTMKAQTAHDQAIAAEDCGKTSSTDGTTNHCGQPPSTSGLVLLIRWANDQDHWIRKIVDNVVQTRSQLSDEHITDVYELFLREKKLAQGDTPNVTLLSSSQVSTNTPTTLQLASLKHIENVNALTPAQEFQFHRRLTVCFGENGSGKTGYVRILTQAAGVRTAQTVLPNIHVKGHGRTPQARIRIKYGDEEVTVDWRGEHSIKPLTRMVVFDAPAALVHVNEDLTYSYTPADLSLFPLVTDSIERVQRRLQYAKEERELHDNPTDNHVLRESKLYAEIKVLVPSANLHEIEALAQVSNEEEASLPSIRENVATLRSGAVRQQITVMRQERAVLTRTLSSAKIVADFDQDTYQNAVAALRLASANHEQARRDTLVGENIPGFLGVAWQEFIEAAEGYISEVGIDPYPDSDAHCIYCRQPLDVAAIALIQKYRDFCNDALRQEVERSRENLKGLCSTVSNLHLDDNERDIDNLQKAAADPSRSRPALTAAREVIRQARILHRLTTAEEDYRPTSDGITNPLSIVQAAVEAAETALENLSKHGEEREQKIEEEQSRLQELEARIMLRAKMPAIKKYVQAVEWVDRCGSYLQKFPAIKRSLTDTAKRASTQMLNSPFQNLFKEECQALRAPLVTLEFPGREGQARRRKSMTRDHKIREILSEGEQKVIALADFLAEAALNPDRSPIVLDDPVTSLDHKRLQHVVDRLVELSLDRQVIVFTHDIWFAAELLGRFDREPRECAYYDITVEDQRIGLIEQGSHPRTDTLADRKRHLTSIIGRAAKESGVNREALVEKGYEQLRGACEIVVEKDLLKGVTERYRPNVRMTVLDQIRADRLPDAIQKIVPIFEKCCGIISSHSQPLVTLGVRPTLDELKADWKVLEDARREYTLK